jgi:Zn-dependent protease with chaperone function
MNSFKSKLLAALLYLFTIVGLGIFLGILGLKLVNAKGIANEGLDVFETKQTLTDDDKHHKLLYVEYANDVFKVLKEHAGLAADNIIYRYDADNNSINAYASSHTGNREVVILNGFIEYALKSENGIDEISFVVAHEIAHHLLGHTKNADHNATHEIEADIYAVKLLKAAGLPCDGGVTFFKYGGTTEFTTHPPSYFRALYINELCEGNYSQY